MPTYLDLNQCQNYAVSLGESAETVISVHLLTNGYCRAYAHDDTIIIQSLFDLAEPTAFGSDPDLIWSLLQSMTDWTCINVPSVLTEPLGTLIAQQMNRRVRYYGDVYHEMRQPARIFSHEAVRLLTPSDKEILEAAPREIQGGGYPDAETLLNHGVAAGAIISGKLVAIAHTSARSTHYADIGVSTLEPFRKKDFSTTAASMVARQLQAEGQIPVWSCGEDNRASLRVAEKVGYQEVLRRSYVILD